jgi:galactitol-specific phosphotransferase system IIC component
MPWRFVGMCALVGAIVGAIFGFVRGLDHTPTLVFAIVEGAILFGFPAGLVGLLLATCWSLAASVRRRVL